MAKVGIVTDSTNCLPAELLKQYNIRVAPYHLILNGKSYLDQIDITPADFWKMFKDLKTLPTTGVPSPGSYVTMFTELAESTDSIVCVTISQALSGAYESASTAREIVLAEHAELKIELIDARNSAGALGLVALEAGRAAETGKSLNEVVNVVLAMVPKVKYISSFDTLKYLIRGGRAPKTAVIGEVIGIKPIIGIVSDTGLVDTLGKERGKKKSMLKMIELIKDHADTSRPLHVIVHYTNNIEDGEQLKEMVTSRYNCAEVYMTDLTPVMTTHTGPAVGISFYS
ncbi:DegV family protein [Chloroflexota bacterium]